LTLIIMASGAASYGLMQALVVPVLPTIRELIHTSQNDVTWVLTAYLLSASIFTPIMGRVGDLFGKKRMFVLSLGALALGSLICALAPNLLLMVAGRVVQGVGAGVLPLGFGIVRDEFPQEKVSAAVGTIASLTAVGSGFALVLAGPIDDLLGTRWLFWLPLIVNVLVAFAAHRLVPESPVRTRGRIGWLPAILLSAALVALLLPLSQASEWGWGSGKVLGLLALAVVLGVLWVVSELKAATPLIDMTMMRRPAVWTNNLVALLVGVGMYSIIGFLPQFLQADSSSGYGFTASITESGLIMLPMTTMSFLGGHYCGRLAQRYGAKWIVSFGCLLVAVGGFGLAFAHGHIWEVVIATVLVGLGIGLVFAAMSSLIVACVPSHQTSVASGMNANIRTIGGAVGAALVGSIISGNVLASGLPKEIGFTLGFVVIAVALLIGAGAGALIPITRTGPLPADEPAHGELAFVAGGTVVGAQSE